MMLSTGSLPAPARLFNTTHWSVVLLAGQSQSPQSDEALEKLCRMYWPPLYVFIRRRGYAEEDARDLTQEFFRLLLQRHDFGAVDPGKGKFRTFLLTSLSHFLSNQRDLAKALKRGGGQNLISLDELDAERAHVELSSGLSPDKLFDVHWAMTVLEHALAQLQQELAAAGRDTQFTELKPYLTDDPDEGDYSAAATRLGVPRQTVAVLVHRLRRRYRELVRTEVAQTVSSPLELEQEMRHLFEALAG